MSKAKNFEIPKEDLPPVNTIPLAVLGVKEGSSKREVLFETLDPVEFEKAYKYHYSSGKYVAVFKMIGNTTGGIK